MSVVALPVAKNENDLSVLPFPVWRALRPGARQSRAGPSGFQGVPSGLSESRTMGTPGRELAQISLDELVFGSRSGAGVEPTERGAATPHRF